MRKLLKQYFLHKAIENWNGATKIVMDYHPGSLGYQRGLLAHAIGTLWYNIYQSLNG